MALNVASTFLWRRKQQTIKGLVMTSLHHFKMMESYLRTSGATQQGHSILPLLEIIFWFSLLCFYVLQSPLMRKLWSIREKAWLAQVTLEDVYSHFSLDFLTISFLETKEPIAIKSLDLEQSPVPWLQHIFNSNMNVSCCYRGKRVFPFSGMQLRAGDSWDTSSPSLLITQYTWSFLEHYLFRHSGIMLGFLKGESGICFIWISSDIPEVDLYLYKVTPF